MTYSKSPLKAAAILSVFAIATATAPSALAADNVYSKMSERVASKVQNQRSDRGNSTNRSDRSTNNTRSVRNTSTVRNNRVTTSNRTQNRTNSRTDTNRQRDYVNLRNTRNTSVNRRTTNTYNNRSNYNRSNNNYRVSSYNLSRRGNGFSQNGYRSNYRSGLGISFSFGSPGYSSYRWAPSNYGFYRPGRISYASYTAGTRCDRVIVDGFQYGTIRPVSVTQCYNPWDGYYIVQGSERIAYNAW